MSELFLLILAIIISGLIMTTIVCCTQLNRLNDLERKILLKENTEEENPEEEKCEVEE